MGILFTHSERCGMLPMFFDTRAVYPDGHPQAKKYMLARDQLHKNYAHGGGVDPFDGFELGDWQLEDGAYLQYPDDHPRLYELARGKLRDETIILFQSDWVAIVQPDGDYLVTRCD